MENQLEDRLDDLLGDWLYDLFNDLVDDVFGDLFDDWLDDLFGDQWEEILDDQLEEKLDDQLGDWDLFEDWGEGWSARSVEGSVGGFDGTLLGALGKGIIWLSKKPSKALASDV